MKNSAFGTARSPARASTIPDHSANRSLGKLQIHCSCWRRKWRIGAIVATKCNSNKIYHLNSIHQSWTRITFEKCSNQTWLGLGKRFLTITSQIILIIIANFLQWEEEEVMWIGTSQSSSRIRLGSEWTHQTWPTSKRTTTTHNYKTRTSLL